MRGLATDARFRIFCYNDYYDKIFVTTEFKTLLIKVHDAEVRAKHLYEMTLVSEAVKKLSEYKNEL